MRRSGSGPETRTRPNRYGAAEPVYVSPSWWNASLTAMPRPCSSLRAASMSETTRYRPWAEPGAAGVTFRAGRSELDDAEVVAGGEVSVEPPAKIAVELLGAIDVRNRDHGDLELHVERPRIGDVDGGGTDLSVHVELLRLGRRPV